MDKAEEMGIITFDQETGTYGVNGIYSKLFQKKTNEYGNQDAAIRAIFAEYTIRTLDNNIELHKMFIGDPAFYKGEVDIAKRLGAIIASGEEMALTTEHWGIDLTETDFSVSTLKTQKLESAYYDDLFNAFLERMPKSDTVAGKAKNVAKVKKLLKPYKNIEQADGQTFITAEMYRNISIRIGEWSPSTSIS